MSLAEISYLIIIAGAVAVFAFMCGIERGEESRFAPRCKLDNVEPKGSKENLTYK